MNIKHTYAATTLPPCGPVMGPDRYPIRVPTDPIPTYEHEPLVYGSFFAVCPQSAFQMIQMSCLPGTCRRRSSDPTVGSSGTLLSFSPSPLLHQHWQCWFPVDGVTAYSGNLPRVAQNWTSSQPLTQKNGTIGEILCWLRFSVHYDLSSLYFAVTGRHNHTQNIICWARINYPKVE